MGCVGTGSFRGFSGLESGAFLGFFAVVAKVRLGVLRVLFVVLVVVWSLIFWGSGFLGHFRSARSGVYMVSRRTDSVIRFGVLRVWMGRAGRGTN